MRVQPPALHAVVVPHLPPPCTPSVLILLQHIVVSSAQDDACFRILVCHRFHSRFWWPGPFFGSSRGCVQ
jgi:hypothetical protein